MGISVKHKFRSPQADNHDAGEVGPDEWNDEHAVTGAVSTDTEVTAGTGLSGGGALSESRTLALDTTHARNVDHTAVTLTAGAGLTGGGDLSANRTFAVGAGTGITVNDDDVALDTLSTRNTDHAGVILTAGDGLTGGGDLTTNRTLAVGAGAGISVTEDAVNLANMAQSTIKGRAAGAGTGAPQDLSATQATAILDAFTGDSGAGGVKGLVPAPGAGDAAAGKFLKASGGWDVPAGSGTGDFTGPASAVSGNLVSFSGTTGKLGADSGVAASTDGTMAANSDAKLPTEKAVKTYADGLITALRDGVAAAYDTLAEIATAIGTLALKATTISAGTGLSGGGDLSANRTLSLADMAQATIKGRASGAGTGAPHDLTGDQVSAIASAATDSAQGVVELATDADAQAGTDTARAVTPANLKAAAEYATFTPSGTGAVPRTIRDRFLEVISLADFPVVANGTSDDLDAFQKAVDEAISSQRALYIPSASFRISGPISVTGPLKLVGNRAGLFGQAGSIIKPDPSANAFNITSQYAVNLSDFGILYPSAADNTTDAAINIDTGGGSAYNYCSRIVGVTIQNAYNPIRLRNAAYTLIDGLTVQEYGNVGVVVEDSTTNGDVGSITIVNSKIMSFVLTPLYGLYWTSAGGLSLQSNVFLGGRGGALLNVRANADLTQVSVVGNSFDTLKNFAFKALRQSTTGKLQELIFANNTCNDVPRAFSVPTDATGAWLTNVSITGNTIRGANSGTAKLIDIDSTDGLTISGNGLTSANAATVGITIGSAVTNARVVDGSRVGTFAADVFGAAVNVDPTVLVNAANDGAAATAGVPVGGRYRNGSVVMVRVA